MRSIAVMNQKGGVGKTTTVVNLSAALAEAGQRICLVDLDPQAHASLHLGIDPRPEEPSVYEVLSGKTRLSEVCRQVSEGLWVVGSSLDLAAKIMEDTHTATVPGSDFGLPYTLRLSFSSRRYKEGIDHLTNFFNSKKR